MEEDVGLSRSRGSHHAAVDFAGGRAAVPTSSAQWAADVSAEFAMPCQISDVDEDALLAVDAYAALVAFAVELFAGDLARQLDAAFALAGVAPRQLSAEELEDLARQGTVGSVPMTAFGAARLPRSARPAPFASADAGLSVRIGLVGSVGGAAIACSPVSLAAPAADLVSA